MAKISDAFSSGIATRINRESLAKEGPRVTRNELIDSFYDAVKEARKERDPFAPPTFGSNWATDQINYDATDPLKIARDLNNLPDAARDSMLATLNDLVKGDKASPEAHAFAQQVLRAIVGPEYTAHAKAKGWGPK